MTEMISVEKYIKIAFIKYPVFFSWKYRKNKNLIKREIEEGPGRIAQLVRVSSQYCKTML